MPEPRGLPYHSFLLCLLRPLPRQQLAGQGRPPAAESTSAAPPGIVFCLDVQAFSGQPGNHFCCHAGTIFSPSLIPPPSKDPIRNPSLWFHRLFSSEMAQQLGLPACLDFVCTIFFQFLEKDCYAQQHK